LADRMALDNVRSTVRRLVEDYSYLPYARDVDLATVELCEDIDCIRGRAVRVLTEVSEEAELYRQLIFMLSARIVLVGIYPYFFAKARGYALYKLPSYGYEYLWNYRMRRKQLERQHRRDILRVYGDLLQLNFAYAPPQYARDTLIKLGMLKRVVDRLEDKVLVTTLQSRALLIGKVPLRPFESSAIDKEKAEKIVSICLGLRQKIVEAFLNLNLRKVEDIYDYAYQWASKEAGKYRGLWYLSISLSRFIYDEVFTVPYYLHHYGIINDGILHY